MHKICNKIKKLRLSSGYHQIVIADELGISQSVYSKIENGKVLPDLNKLIRIVNLYKIDFNELFDYYGPTEFETLKNEIKNLKTEISTLRNHLGLKLK
jgi:transcriptional regulator with XRE-family HTH domain